MYFLLLFTNCNSLTQETSDVNLKRTAILKALCIYLGEDEGQLVWEYIVSHWDGFACHMLCFKILMSPTYVFRGSCYH